MPKPFSIGKQVILVMISCLLSALLAPAYAQHLSQAEMNAFVQAYKDNVNHAFSYQKGLEYGYEQQLSKNASDAGIAQQPLLFFRYLGYKGSVYTVASDDGSAVISCDLRDACKFATIKSYLNGMFINSEVVPADGTIAQSVLLDAIAGNLGTYNADVDRVMQSNDWNDNGKYSDALLEMLSPEPQKFANEYWPAEKSCGFTDPATPSSTKDCHIAHQAYRALHKAHVCWTQDSDYSDMAQHRWGFCPPNEDLIINSIPPEPLPPPQAPQQSTPPASVMPAAPNQPGLPPVTTAPRVTVPTLPAVKVSPSFDCRKAYFADEVTICSTPELATLDNLLASIYKQAKAKANDMKDFAREQRKALVERRDCGMDVNCLLQWYKQRNAVLSRIALGQSR